MAESTGTTKGLGWVVTTWTAALTLLGGLIFYVWAVSANLFGLFGGMPDLDQRFNLKSEWASGFYSQEEELLGKYFRENRSPVAFKELSPNLVRALIATEDIRFEKHSGVDFMSTMAIPLYLATGNKPRSSTISLELAKNLFKVRPEAYKGSLTQIPGLGEAIVMTKEWISAIKLERVYTKEEIITTYLNTVDFGANAYGIEASARTYFGKKTANLTVPEASLLIGMLKGTIAYSPIFYPDRALLRRNVVIDDMVRYDFLFAEEALAYQKQPIMLSTGR